jgi:hypothetical protein
MVDQLLKGSACRVLRTSQQIRGSAHAERDLTIIVAVVSLSHVDEEFERIARQRFERRMLKRLILELYVRGDVLFLGHHAGSSSPRR